MVSLGMSKGAWDACWDVYKVDVKEKWSGP